MSDGKTNIPLNKPYLTGGELAAINTVFERRDFSGDSEYSRHCETLLADRTGACGVLVTHSCTGALEMAALLLDLSSGDEIIMPSFTFVSSATAFVLRGATPVFVDIRPDTLNIDETKIEAAITERTKAICIVHYAGVSCEMDAILEIAEKYGLSVIEDAAHAICATYKGRPLGSMGKFGTYSFHDTKNITCGEGGALLINDETYLKAAEIIHQKGTDRRSFERREVDKYTWKSQGSSFLLGELHAAMLSSQLEHADDITFMRKTSWEYYHERLEALENMNLIKRPAVPSDCNHNAHIYYVVLSENFDRNMILRALHHEGVFAQFHYVPLHSSDAGRKFGRVSGELRHTDDISNRLIRLPLWCGINKAEQDIVVKRLTHLLEYQGAEFHR